MLLLYFFNHHWNINQVLSHFFALHITTQRNPTEELSEEFYVSKKPSPRTAHLPRLGGATNLDLSFPDTCDSVSRVLEPILLPSLQDPFLKAPKVWLLCLPTTRWKPLLQAIQSMKWKLMLSTPVTMKTGSWQKLCVSSFSMSVFRKTDSSTLHEIRAWTN